LFQKKLLYLCRKFSININKKIYMKKFAIVLSGCGVYDGAEVQESVTAMLAVCRRGHIYQVFAPNIEQNHVINHITYATMNETRNVMVEAARIARGNVKDLSLFDASQYDVLLFVGGLGAAKNLSDFAFKSTDYTVIDDVAKAIHAMHNAGKPIGAMCISPILVANVLDGVELTLGDHCVASEVVEKHGAIHKVTTHGEVIVDVKNKVATTPCYMLDATLTQVAAGADNIVEELLKLM
jgi:enhancing lycopene biosynthesis protein 2